MSVDGLWKIIVKAPMGVMETELDITSDGNTLSGVQTGQGQTLQVQDGKIDGDTISWVQQISKPMSMKLVFTGVVNGDQITGKVKAGLMGAIAFTGSRESKPV